MDEDNGKAADEIVEAVRQRVEAMRVEVRALTRLLERAFALSD